MSGKFTVIPSTKKATVTWGKKKFGIIAPHAPLIVQRPRDSGPLDVMVKSDGCVSVQTRAYTFEDSKVSVNDLIIKAAALGLREFPNLNASFDDSAYTGATWQINVCDDDPHGAGATVWSDGLLDGTNYDANGNSLVWVRSEATVEGIVWRPETPR